MAIGAAGVLSVVPALNDLAYGFGLLQIVWFAWLGIVMLPWATSASRAWRQAPSADHAGSRADPA
jgi:hypothetical protein